MHLAEFKEQVKHSVDLYLTDYFKPEIEWDFEEEDSPRAYVTIKVHPEEKPCTLTLGLDEDGELGVECGESSYLSPDDGGFMTCLFFEVRERLTDPNH